MDIKQRAKESIGDVTQSRAMKDVMIADLLTALESAEAERDRYKERFFKTDAICTEYKETLDRIAGETTLPPYCETCAADRYQEALEMIADDADCTDLDECKHVARQTLAGGDK